ncbi:hypothetical protein [Metabacillus fastidiosus]|uniref:YqbF C-terminal domain-containing protein n=1 Tax=Metabacillus fastidiosus TaxID=1458 RepID=A0ABU6NT55_9BACI|nr:hypothetical protein [Metabacillus fastidiosus]
MTKVEIEVTNAIVDGKRHGQVLVIEKNDAEKLESIGYAKIIGEVEVDEDPVGEYTEASLKKLSADEQKALVETLNGNLEELTNEEKRIAFILENQ